MATVAIMLAATLVQTQRRWTSEIRDACNEVECMLKAYEDRTAEFENP